MKNGGYSQWLEEKIKSIPVGKPFESVYLSKMLEKNFELNEIHSRAITNNKLMRMTNEQQLQRINKGVYYRTKKTVFGLVPVDCDKYAIQILTQDRKKIIGYESGSSFLNKLGLSSLMPKNIEIVSNNYRKKLPSDCHIIVKKPVIPINNKNYQYLQILDAVFNVKRLHTDSINPKSILSNAVKARHLDPILLLGYAKEYYSQTVVLDIVDIITK